MTGAHSRYSAGGKGFITENNMLQAIEEKLLLINGWLRISPVGKFFRWWIEELRLAMPASWQQRLQYALRRVTLLQNGGVLEIGAAMRAHGRDVEDRLSALGAGYERHMPRS